MTTAIDNLEDLPPAPFEDFTNEIRATKEAEDFDFTKKIEDVLCEAGDDYTDSDIARINRYLVIYSQQSSRDAAEYARNRAHAEESSEILLRLDKALCDALAGIDAATENSYCKATLLDAIADAHTITDVDMSIDFFNHDIETVRRLSAAVSTAIQWQEKSERVPKIALGRGRPPVPDIIAIEKLLAQLYEACLDILDRPLKRQKEEAYKPVQDQKDRKTKADTNYKQGNISEKAHTKLVEAIKNEIKQQQKLFAETEREIELERAALTQHRTCDQITGRVAKLAAISNATRVEKRIRNILIESNPDRLPAAAIHTVGIEVIDTND